MLFVIGLAYYFVQKDKSSREDINKITEVTIDWQVFSMTNVPQGWSNGFPK